MNRAKKVQVFLDSEWLSVDREVFVLFTQGLRSAQMIAKQKRIAFHLLHKRSAFSDYIQRSCASRFLTQFWATFTVRNSFFGLGVASGPTFRPLTPALNSLHRTLVLNDVYFLFVHNCAQFHQTPEVQTPDTAAALLTPDTLNISKHFKG